MNSGCLSIPAGNFFVNSAIVLPFGSSLLRISSFEGNSGKVAEDAPEERKWLTEARDMFPIVAETFFRRTFFRSGVECDLPGRDGAGLAARDPFGEFGREFAAEPPKRILSFLRPTSLVSPSLPEPAARARCWFTGLATASPDVASAPCFFLIFLREDSLPLASERLGDPGRLRIPLRNGSAGLILVGVLVPLTEDGADGGFGFASSFALPLPCCCCSSAFFRSSSFNLSVSLSSDSLCSLLAS